MLTDLILVELIILLFCHIFFLRCQRLILSHPKLLIYKPYQQVAVKQQILPEISSLSHTLLHNYFILKSKNVLHFQIIKTNWNITNIQTVIDHKME